MHVTKKKTDSELMRSRKKCDGILGFARRCEAPISAAKLLFILSTMWWFYFQAYFMQNMTKAYSTNRLAEARTSRIIVTNVENTSKNDVALSVPQDEQSTHEVIQQGTQEVVVEQWDQENERENHKLQQETQEIESKSILEQCLTREQYAAVSHPIPSVLLLGGDKCGSTTLQQGLTKTKTFRLPKVFKGESNVKYKEIYFFNENWVNKDVDQCTKTLKYLERFAHGTSVQDITGLQDKLSIDATPNYGREGEVVKRVYRFYPAHLRQELKFLWVIRNPSARALSWHRFCRRLHENGYRDWWILDCVSHQTVENLVLDEAVKVISCLKKYPCSGKQIFEYSGRFANQGKKKYTSNQQQEKQKQEEDEHQQQQQQLPPLLQQVKFQCQQQWDKCSSSSPVLGGGMFAQQIRSWHNYFAPKQFMVLFSDDLRSDPQKSFFRALKHIHNGVSPSLEQVDAAVSIGSVNTQGKYEKDLIAMKTLDRFFASHNRELIGLVDGAEAIDWIVKQKSGVEKEF